MGRSGQKTTRLYGPMLCLTMALPLGCSLGFSRGEAGEAVRLVGATMGTTYQVRIADARTAVARRALQQEIEQLLDEINGQMSTYRRESEISRFNRAPAGEWFDVSPATAAVVAAGLDVSRKTGGALDVTVGPVVRLWHFGPPVNGADGPSVVMDPPGDDQLDAARRAVGYEKLGVRRKPPALRKQVDALEVDLSAIAKGYAVDRVAALLGERGYEDYMVEIGGEVRVSGWRPDGRPWRIAIERPLPNRRELHSVVPLTDAALATSGDYRNYFEHDGRRYSHILDPATGRPIEHELVSVSVASETCMTADAWSTALLVLGRERGFDLAERHGIAALFLSPTDEDSDNARLTTAWKSRFPDSSSVTSSDGR